MSRETSSKSRRLSFETRSGLWFTMTLLCAGCGAVKERATSPPKSVAQQSASLQDRLRLLANRYGICDVAVAVIRNRELQSVDTAHTCADEPSWSQESVFEAASLSKPVFAYAVLKLVQQGKLDLDAPVLKYLPNGYAHRYVAVRADSKIDQVSDPKLSEVTVRMALNHTSGLPNWSDGPLFFNNKPGVKWQYSGEGYVLLQRAVEAVTGENLADFMRRTVFNPLGMTHSAYTRQANLENHLVRGSDSFGSVLTSYPLREPVAAFTLYTSAGDYGRFLVTLLKDDRILAQIVESPVPVSHKLDLSWGLGWGLEQNRGALSLWHWGNNSGYRNFVMASPRTGDGFVMFTNSDKGLSLAEPVGNAILPGPHPVYRFHLLHGDIAIFLCETLDICP